MSISIEGKQISTNTLYISPLFNNSVSSHEIFWTHTAICVLHTHVKDVRQAPMVSDEVPAHFQKQNSITVSELRLQLVSEHS